MTPLAYRLSVPGEIDPERPICVAIHGISRNADEVLTAFAPLAEESGLVLLAPRFDEKGFRDYQRLGRAGRGPRADLALERAVDAVRGSFGIRSSRLLLFGYSGGAQFAHRYCMTHPENVAAAVVAAAGWYTLPDERRAYPYGLRLDDALPGARVRLRALLEVPMLVTVGSEDTEQGPALRRSRRIDRQQGIDRIERGERFVSAMRLAATRRGVTSRVDFERLPGAGHAFGDAVSCGLADRTLRFLLGAEHR